MDEGTKAGLAAFVEAGGAAFALGYLHGRKGEMPSKAGIPLDGALGLGLTALAAVVGPKLGNKKMLGATPAGHLFNLGAGASAYFLGSYGGQMGQKARAKAKELTGPTGEYLQSYLTPEDKAQIEAAKKASPWRSPRTITSGAPYGAMPMSTPAWNAAR